MARPLANAFTYANELVNTATGAAPGNNLPAGYTVPIAELNTLADIISACINSVGGTAGDGSLCGQLFTLTTVTPNPPPTNTIAALLNIVNNPTQNTSALFALTPPTPPFQPTLTSAPANFQVELVPPANSVTLTASASFTIVGALQDLTLTNQGSTAVNVASVTESDSGTPDSPYFTIEANNCGASLAAQSSCTITVLSASSPTGSQPTSVTGTLTVTDSAGTQTASLTSADAYAVEVSDFPLYVPGPGTVSFPTIPVGTSETGTILIYTPWTSRSIAPPLALTLSGANPGDFTASTFSHNPPAPSSTCPDNYGYGEQCQITYTFKPAAAGQRSAKLSLDPSFGTATGQYILLQGTGVSGSSGFRTDRTSLSLQSYLPGNLDPRSAGAATITVTNFGSTTVSLTSSVTGTAAPYVSASVANCTSLDAQATCQVTVTFNASAVGSYTGTLTLADSSSGFSVSLPITATASYWPAVAIPALLNFGSITVGSSTTAQNFVIADPNGYPLGHAYSVALQPSSNFELTQGSTCAASTTQTCTLAAAFAPQTTGHISEAATITDQTTGLTTQLALYGTSGTATYTLSTTGIVFPPSITGVASTPVAVTLTANGTQPISISGISITGSGNNNFNQTNNCSTVAVGSTCTINITFTPASAGTPSATLQIASNGVNSPTSISLSGTASSSGGSPVLQISPSPVTFPATIEGTLATQTITITNTAAGPVTISSASISGATGATFNLASNTCTMLSAGGSCTLSLTANPSAAMATGSLVVTSTTADSPQTVPLSITGTSGATSGGSTATITPSPFIFTIWGAHKDFTVTNTGTAGLTVSTVNVQTTGAGIQHAYSTSNNTCTNTLSPSAACTFTISPYLLQSLSSIAAFDGNTGEIFVNDDASTGSGQQTAALNDNETAYLGVGGTNGNATADGSVTFPGNQVGSTQTATIQLANLTIGSPAATLTLGGANPGDFSVSALEPSVSSTPSSSCPGTGTAVCTITITFKPTAVGTRSAKISLDSVSTSTGQYIYVTGNAIGPGPSFSTNPSGSVSLASNLPVTADPNSTGRKTIIVTNTGTTTLDLAAAVIGANASSFTVDNSQCPSLPPQATCPINVTFSATTGGNYSATLFLSDTSSSASAAISLTGQTNYWSPAGSLWYPLGPAVSYYLFPNQEVNTLSAPLSFTVTNKDGYPLGDPISISVSSDLVLPNGGYCPASTTQPCTVVVQFDPQKTGALGDFITFTDTITGSTTVWSFEGTGIP